jgi:hypothetical protein
MTTKVLTMLLVAASFVLGGCTTLTEYGSVRKEILRNDQGHVIGHKELLRNEQTGEVIAQVSLYAPMLDNSGALIGYEEQAKGGAIIRDLDGRTIGSKFSDLRSRKSMTIVMRPTDAQQMAAVQPKIWQLMASLSASDLRRVQ